jgi:hypothetical protein
MEDNLKEFKDNINEERRKNRWILGIIITVVNIIVNVSIHLVGKI